MVDNVKIGDCFWYHGRIYVVVKFVIYGLGLIYCKCIDCENNIRMYTVSTIQDSGIIQI